MKNTTGIILMDGENRRDIVIPIAWHCRVIKVDGRYYIQDEEREYLYTNVEDEAVDVNDPI